MQETAPLTARRTTPAVSSSDAVLLFADLAGFSDLSARLVASDTRGAEAIHDTLNPMISAIMETVAQHGGLTIGLHGDAVTAVWPLAQAKRALRCAQGLAGAVAGATHDGDPLPIRTVLDAGELSRIAATDGPPLFAGPVLGKLRAEAPKARANDIHQTSRFRQLLTRADAMPPFPRDWATDTADKGEAAWLAEFRTSTILIAQVDPLPGQEVQNCLLLSDLCAGQAELHQGQMLHLAQDDKGLVALIGWGLATSATEEDADLAIAVGRTLSAELRENGLRPNIAIGCGKSLSGVLGSATTGHFTVLGDHVNRAAGALPLSRGKVLCDTTVMAKAIRHEFDKPFEYKAKTGQTYQLAAARNIAQRQLRFSSRLVGRTAELARLRGFCEGQNPDEAVLWLSGEAGEGKSHLVAESLSSDTFKNMHILRGIGDRLGQMTAYRVWQNIFEGLEVRPELSAVTRPYAALLNPVLPGFAEETPETLQLSPVARARRAQELMGEVLAGQLGAREVLLVLEDAHWMDTASWLLLAEVQRRVPQLRILAVSRPREREELTEEAQAILMAPGAVSMRLGPLTDDDGAELIRATLGANVVGAPFLRRILAHTGGHALYTVELVSSLLDTGAVRVEDGHCISTAPGGDLQDLRFPDGVEAAIAARIARLATGDQLLLKVASVQGRDFRSAPLSAAGFAGLKAAEIDPSLQRLVRHGLIEPSPGAEWRFHHALTRETTYDLLTRDQARQLHGATAEFLEGQQSEAPAVLAYHWTRAGQAARALPWLDQAASLARDADANAEALSFVEQAFEAADQLGTAGSDAATRQRWHAIATKSALTLGLHDETVDHAHRALRLNGQGLPQKGIKRVLPLLREVVRYKRADPGRLSGTRPEAAGEVRSHLSLTEVYYDRQDTISLLMHGMAAMNAAYRAVPNSNETALAHMSMAMLGFHAPAIAKSGPHLNEALRLAQTADPAVATRVYVVAGNYHLGAGNWADGREQLQKAVRLAEESREARNGTIALASLGNVVRLEGFIRESDDYAKEVHAVGQDRSVAQFQIWGLAGRLRALTRLGDWDSFDQALAMHRALLSYPPNWENCSMSSRIALDLCGAIRDLHFGKVDAGREQLMRAGEMYRAQSQVQVFSIDLPIYFGDALLRLETLAPGGSDTRDLAALMATRGKKYAKVYPPAKPRAAMAAGDLALLNGKTEEALKNWADAEQAAQDLRMPLEEAAAAHRLSAHGQAEATERRDRALRTARIALPEIWLGT